ncbi:hypothetical protein LBMAG42_21320 [Deltaproteobacteria bacterium]|nr:hypothetical protein LBMAG42_21320 [Deltaproteobacteria bacterium]
MRYAFLLPFAAACSDYNLNNSADPNGEGDSGDEFSPDTALGDMGQCGDPDMSRQEVGIDESCEAEAITGTFTPVIKWQQNGIGDAYVTPVVGQLTDDNGNGVIDAGDTPDVVVANYVGVVYAMSGDTGRILWQGGNLGAEPMTAAIGDLDGDGWPEVVGAGSSGMTAFNGKDGSVKWNAGAYSGGHTPPCGAVGIYDLDGDGTAEVVIGHTIWNYDGSIRARGAGGDGSGHEWAAAYGVAADIDRDGALDIVVGNAVLDANGATKWNNGKGDGFVAIANFDSDKKGEIVVAGTGDLRLQDHDGTVIWSRSRLTGSTIGPPTVADFDGDGEPEIGVAGMGSYTVVDTDGATLWTRTTNDYSSGFTGSAVFDFEGDGQAEVVYADENDVFVFDGATGAIKMKETQHSSATCSESPSIADVDNDGHADILYTSSVYSGPESGVTVISDADNSWMPGSHVWNQHAYAITNVNDDATIPASPDVNWDSYNTFRSADMSAADGGLLTDAVPALGDICNDECKSGHLYVTVVVGNQGLADLPAGVPISMWSGSTWLATLYTDEVVAPGKSTKGMIFDLDPAQITDTLKAKADDDEGIGVVVECNEDNNSMKITKGLCK